MPTPWEQAEREVEAIKQHMKATEVPDTPTYPNLQHFDAGHTLMGSSTDNSSTVEDYMMAIFASDEP